MELTVLGQSQTTAPRLGSYASSGWVNNDDQLNHQPEHIRAKVHNHPCYSEEAHHHYARMHVTIALTGNTLTHPKTASPD